MTAKPKAPAPSDATPTSPASVLDRMLGTTGEPKRPVRLADATVLTWTDGTGTLTDGRTVKVAESCLLRPAAGDRVLIYDGEGGERWILTVLDRAGAEPTVVETTGPLTIKAPRVALSAGAVHIHAKDFLTSTRNRHAVEHVRTETVHTRVAQIGTDIRRASHVTDEVEGTVLQRAGTWISTTVREARLHAKAFLFD